MTELPMSNLAKLRKLSPRRHSSDAIDLAGLVTEQLRHFGIDPASEFGHALSAIALKLYAAQDDLDTLWRVTMQSVQNLDRADRIAFFNAKKFLSFQLAKLLDDL